MTPKQFRIFRNHFLCDACPCEWSTEVLVIASEYCPCCDALCHPYDSEALLDDVLMDEETV